jgi:HSP20 family protein
MKDLIPWRKREENMERARGQYPVNSLQHRMNTLFEDFFADMDGFWGVQPRPLMRILEQPLIEAPRFEVSETEEEFRIKAELPGLDEKDIEVEVDRDGVLIKGEKRREQEEKKRNYYISEMSYGQFSRLIPLPETVDRDKVQAQFKKGVLTLTLPKTEQAKVERKRVAITTE